MRIIGVLDIETTGLDPIRDMICEVVESENGN